MQMLTAYEMGRFARLTRALDAACEAPTEANQSALARMVERGRIPTSKRQRERAAADLARLREVDAPDTVLTFLESRADPKGAMARRIMQGTMDIELDELAPFVLRRRLLVPLRDVVWALAPTDGAQRDLVQTALEGSTRCSVAGRRRMPHWREQHLPHDAQAQCAERLGPCWNANWHDDDGVERAAALFSAHATPVATSADAASCPDYLAATQLRPDDRTPGVYHDFGGVLTEFPRDPRPCADATLRRVARKLLQLRSFFDECRARRWHVHSAPPADAL